MARKKGTAPGSEDGAARPAPWADEQSYVFQLIDRICRECPRRQPTSPDEKRAQEILETEMQRVGLTTRWHEFRFNDHLYKNVALHFGLGVLGTAVSGVAPLAGLALHLGPTASYWADSTRRGYYLRRVLGFKPSQNLLGVLPARTGQPRIRVVILAHADAAFTGKIFDPVVIEKGFSNLPPNLAFLRRSLAFATRAQASLAFFDVLRLLFGPLLTLPLRPLEIALTVPSLAATILNLEVVLRNEIVPGANDNLSGAAALPVLAWRLAADQPDDVEYVFAVSGCEEASLGGGDALARDMDGQWDKSRTVIIGLDSLTNGDLNYLDVEGEVVQVHVPTWLANTVKDVAASEPRFAEVKPFEVPVGGSDVAAFLNRGWDGVCLTCIDPRIGAPRHYHQPTDDPGHLEMDILMKSIDFTEKLAREVVRRKL